MPDCDSCASPLNIKVSQGMFWTPCHACPTEASKRNSQQSKPCSRVRIDCATIKVDLKSQTHPDCLDLASAFKLFIAENSNGSRNAFHSGSPASHSSSNGRIVLKALVPASCIDRVVDVLRLPFQVVAPGEYIISAKSGGANGTETCQLDAKGGEKRREQMQLNDFDYSQSEDRIPMMRILISLRKTLCRPCRFADHRPQILPHAVCKYRCDLGHHSHMQDGVSSRQAESRKSTCVRSN